MLRRLILTIFILLLLAPVQAQEPVDNYGSKLAELSRAYLREPQGVEPLYSLAMFYFDNSNPMRSLPLAMDFATRAEQSHIDLLQRNRVSDLVKLQRNSGITINVLHDLRVAISEAALSSVRTRDNMTMAEVDLYLATFGPTDAEIAKLLRARRYRLIADDVLSTGTADESYDFLNTYPGTEEAAAADQRLGDMVAGLLASSYRSQTADSLVRLYPKSKAVARLAVRRKAQLAFDNAERDGSIEAYGDFLALYPASDESDQARQRIDKLLEEDLAKRHTAVELAHFADSNADHDISDQALARLRRLIYVNRDAQAAQYYVDHFKLDPFVSEVYSRYYSWHAFEGNGAPLERFAAANPDFPFPRALEDDLERATEVDGVPLMEPFQEKAYDRYAAYIHDLSGKAIAIVPLQRMLQPLVAQRRWADAQFRLEQFELEYGEQWQWQYDALRRLVTTPTPGYVSRAEALDADSVSMHHPVVNPADKRLYFSDGGRICSAVHTARGWHLADTLRMTGAEGVSLTLFCFYDGGRRMLLGHGGDIWIAERDDDGWRISDIPPYPVNTDYVETDAYMLPDGSGLLLASDRPGGQNLQPSRAYFHGDTALATDLWFIPCTSGRWGTPVNLGVKVNSLYSERSPILSRNMTTLYFVSDGSVGLGYGDVYMAERTDPDDWTSWSTPQNLGREVNSGFRELSVSFSPDERRIYLSTDASGRATVRSFATAHNTTSATGRYALDVAELQHSLLRLQVADMERQTVVQQLDCEDDSTLQFSLQKGRRYALLADAGTRFVTATEVEPSRIADYRLPAYTFAELVAMDRPLPLPVVQFSADGEELLPVARMQLTQLARFVQRHPGAVLEFVVDVAGPDARQCYAQAETRCQTLLDFLTQRGIAAGRILLSPYGNARVGQRSPSAVGVRFRE